MTTSVKKHPTIEEAIKMVDYKNEVTAPVLRNGLVCENESMFYKIRALINCPKYEAFQSEFYDLDPDNISPELEEKINKMYRKAVASGDIEGTDDGEERVDMQTEFGSDDEDDGFGTDDVSAANDNINPYRADNFKSQYSYNAMPSGDLNLNEIPASGPVVNTFTCLYTALDRDGGYKTGKFYSNASSADTARIDAVSKLAAFGYKNIEIAAVETGTITPQEVVDGNMGDDIEQVPPEEQIQSEESNGDDDNIPVTTPVELSDDEKLQMFSDWFQSFKSTLYDMDVESLTQLNDDQKKEFWTRLKTKTVEMPQDPRTFISKTTMDKLEQGTFPYGVEPELPVAGETADADEDVQAVLNANPSADMGVETGNEGPGESGNEPVFNGGADNGGMEEISSGEEGGGETQPAEPATPAPEQTPATQPAQPAEQPAEQPVRPANNGEEEGEEVVTEDEDDGEIDWFNLPDDWAEQPDDWDDGFDITSYLKVNPDDGIVEPEQVIEQPTDGVLVEIPDYEPTVEPPAEEPVEQFGAPVRKCFYNVVREKNPYNGDGPFANE